MRGACRARTVRAVPPFLQQRRPRSWADALLAATLLVVGQSQVWGGWADGGVGTSPHGDRVARAALAVFFAVPLAWRRRRPLSVVTVICAAIACQLLFVVAYVPFLAGLVPMAVANYTAAAYGGRWRVAGLGGVLVAESVIYARIPAERVSGEVLFAVFVALGTWVIGDVVRARSQRAQQALGDAQKLVTESHAATAAALADERARIARELHDVIAHSVSVMGVQAGAARTLIDHDPDAARAALLQVEAAARSSVGELQRLLAVLREDRPGTATRAPQPGLAQLEAVVEQIRAAGLEVRMQTEGLLDLPPGVDLAAFRIVQEALTNALKHSGAPTSVSITRRRHVLTIEVINAGSARVPTDGRSAAGCGHGLIGMRERVQLYGGSLHAGRESGGAFVVRAVLPVTTGAELDAVS